MVGSTDFVDEIDCGSFFDDLIDFPNGDVELDSTAAFPSIWTTQHESLPCSDSVFSTNSASDPSAELFVPYEDIVQLEWMSNFVEDSHCRASLTIKKEESSSIRKASHHQFRTCSPISVLESSSSYSEAKPLACSPETVAPGKRRRARSKCPCPVPSDSENYAKSQLLIKLLKQVNAEHKKKKKKKKIKLSLSDPAGTADDSQHPTAQVVRKCMHCEITKTPQWRAGPMGPKTLCNACGVRYKSGRLFPEYRPAASPTFVPSKVVP
ncbi:hypothetical protein F3Y22_tig00111132pilonHSYRG00103 [Hibiscus syriacus]|uniref:GATA-type domain-containing protein n=1 Tax=Hibiscus syriacus TaxID=106335 RepID=A0A6A2YXU5_HIBSY|nr:hypothetical protein F3Y22_tig00111132pilonHSYRG00103 [Hibiscus syriacus]